MAMYAYRPLAVSVLAFAIAACGGNSSNGTDDPQLGPDGSLEQYLKQGFVNSRSEDIYEDDAAAPPDVSDSVSDGGVSDTNTQEAGVDEADLIKLNSNYLYAYKPRQYDAGSRRHASIEVYEIDGNPIASEHKGSVPLPDISWGVEGLYLVDDALVTIAHGDVPSMAVAAMDSGFASTADGAVSEPFYGQQQTTSVTVFGLQDPALPERLTDLSIEGYLISSRRIGDTLYMVSKFSPAIAVPYWDDVSQEDWQRRIEETPLEDMLPRYWVNGEEAGRLFTDGKCYLPDQDDQGGYPSIIAITKVDLSNPQNWESQCASGRIDGVYASANAFFITGGWYGGETRIDQYDLESFTRVATGKVAGNLSGSMPSFRLSEKDGYLRVVTSSTDDFWIGIPEVMGATTASEPEPEGPEHRLYVLKANAEGGFDQVAVLPNEQRPAAIGKPGEEVKSVRYRGDKAYVVTFERTDPLYVINLSNPADPFIEGELEVTGFSEYLHPLANDLLLGLGRSADQEGNITGLKLSLFSTVNPAAPVELQSYALGERWAYSDALWNHRAISFLEIDGVTRMAFAWNDYPADSYQAVPKLHVVDIDHDQQQMQVQVDNTYKTNEPWGGSYTRVPLHNDGVHLVNDGAVTSKTLLQWQQ
ncbi:beta-propeller domain-containing protein [Bacterioplanes sanyensis]|uniref:beta-propeller domain-containing protein n=1 Tax=Bacterioplanes sanyensis TaxID=1249553 RepID=UPI00167A0F76|nr:beta-propeller domain-containing protein [Bacterioplanes sanyensis]